jgi:hypothetical protein
MPEEPSETGKVLRADGSFVSNVQYIVTKRPTFDMTTNRSSRAQEFLPGLPEFDLRITTQSPTIQGGTEPLTLEMADGRHLRFYYWANSGAQVSGGIY